MDTNDHKKVESIFNHRDARNPKELLHSCLDECDDWEAVYIIPFKKDSDYNHTLYAIGQYLHACMAVVMMQHHVIYNHAHHEPEEPQDA